MSQKEKILFIYKDFSLFVQKDYKILSDQFIIQKYKCNISKNLVLFIWFFLRQFVFLISNLHKYSIVYCWFADYHSFLPALFTRAFNKKFFLVIGGYDVAKIPEFNYGSFSKPFRAFCAAFSLKNATCNLPVGKNLAKKIKLLEPKAEVFVLPTGYDPEKFPFIRGQSKLKQIITVSITNSLQRIKIKGLDRFVELAAIVPDYEFIIIGIDTKYHSLLGEIPENLKLVNKIVPEELLSYYQKSMYYAQFSRAEGFPNAVCEAMLCGCIPLGIRVGDIPTAIGNCGLITKNWQPEIIRNFIYNITEIDELANQCRSRIVQKYHEENRIDKLIPLLSKVKKNRS